MPCAFPRSAFNPPEAKKGNLHDIIEQFRLWVFDMTN